MRERPILFSAPMVRAILAGEKTQARRVVRTEHGEDIGVVAHDPASGRWEAGQFGDYGRAAHGEWWACPYGVPGDRLWVRETFASWEDEDCDDGPQTYVAYAATPRVGYRSVPDRARICYLDESTPIDSDSRLLGPWRPSIFMPRVASRIDLEIVNVRVERLQDITEEDARAEGIGRVRQYDEDDKLVDPHSPNSYGYTPPLATYAGSFEIGWDTINGKRAPWASNPWVWALTFRRVRP